MLLFASRQFIVFLPAVLLGYHLLRRREHRYRWLLAASWLFYAYVPPHYWPVIVALTALDYFAALRIESGPTRAVKKFWLAASVVANLGLLFAFKYTPFAYDNLHAAAGLVGAPLPTRVWEIVLPLGISFHTFQGISYTVDVYRGHIRAVRDFGDYALFVSFFPQLAAGPIVRAAEFLPQMASPPPVTRGMVADGVVLFCCGLAKKLVVADHLDELLVGPVFASPEGFDPAARRLAVAAWAVQIYCDFSGYTDMARGISKWFGFELPENFRLPYLATSITDFWRRWHLSLSTWLRDYVYFPLGGSRGSGLRTYSNLMLLFVLCGLWHGATWAWLVYGVYNGVLMGLHRAYDRALADSPGAKLVRGSAAWALVAWAATTVQFLVGLVLIRQHGWAGGLTLMRALVGLDSGSAGGAGADSGALVAILMALGLAGHAWGLMLSLAGRGGFRFPEGARLFGAACCLAACVVFAPGSARPFIYIQF